MKSFFIAVSVVVLVFAVAVQAQTQAQPKSGSVEQELMKLEKQWGDAAVKPDIGFLDQILADDFTDIDFEGSVFNKAEELGNLKLGELVITSLVMDDLKVRVYGDAAVVMGRNTVKAQFKGKDTGGQYRWTDTWIKRAGRWQCVATQGTKIVQK